MGFPYVFDRERRFVLVTLSGNVSGRDIAQVVETLYRDPQWQPGNDVIWNCAKVQELIFQKDDIDALVGVRHDLADRGGHGRDVVVIKRILDDGMARLYAAMRRSDHRRTHLCASERTAFEILARDRSIDRSA